MDKNNTQSIDMPLKDFVETTIKDVEAGLSNNFKLKDTIDFELMVVASNNKDGKVDLKVLKGGKDTVNEKSQKIKFSVCKRPPAPF